MDPATLVDLGFRLYHPLDIDRVYCGLHPIAGFVRRCAIEHPERARRLGNNPAAELFSDLTRERGHIAFVDISFAARLHESRRPALANQQHAAVIVANQRSDHTDYSFTHSSSPKNKPNWLGSRAGTGKPRC